ncbi:hypothetical protein F4808DRAFT_447112 [Astrocystis sublimbata]|nr:hypothetical protein F4808DRAFT_447112 [Astrocystis sublimbata]
MGVLCPRVNIANKMLSAMRDVSDILELFELILLQCDNRTLLTSARRVSHRWHDVIDSSPTIQEALFFRPTIGINTSSPVLNPILVEDFSLFFDDHVHTRASFQRLPIAGEDGNGRREAFMREDASWRRMLVRQPPVKQMGIWCWVSSWGFTAEAGSFRQPSPTEFCCGLRAYHNKLCENCQALPSEPQKHLNLTMGMLYDDGVRTVLNQNITHFTYFWEPKSQASFAFAGGPQDQKVVLVDGDRNPQDRRLLSEVAKEVDLIKATKYINACSLGGRNEMQELRKFEGQFRYQRG